MSEETSLKDEADALSTSTTIVATDLLELRKAMADISEESKKLGRSFEGDIQRALATVITSGSSLSDVMQKLALSMADKAFNQAISPISEGISAGIGNLMSGFFENIMPFAAGGIVQNGSLQRFAQGGVVSQPSYFGMQGGAGLMGEAGPEAIMPLKRGADGKLGVAAEASAPVSVVIFLWTLVVLI